MKTVDGIDELEEVAGAQVRHDDTDGPGTHGATLAAELLARVPQLADELVERVLVQVDIYGEGPPVPVRDLRASARDNLEFMLLHLDSAAPLNLGAPRRTGRTAAKLGASLADIQRTLQIGVRFLWGVVVAEAHRSGSVSDAELVGLASRVWTLHEEFTAATASAYRDALINQAPVRDQEPSPAVDALFDGRVVDTATVWAVADRLGLPYQGRFVVVAAEVPAFARQALPDIEGRLHVRGIGSAWRQLPDLQVGVVSLRSERSVPPVLGLLRSAASSRVGVSPVYADLAETPRALHLARIALASSSPGAAGVCLFDEAPLPVLVVSSPTTSYRIVQMVLGPLLEINADERETLLNTLGTYFAVHGSAIEAGKRLYCHANTVRHRLRRIEHRTGRSLDDPLASAELCVALEALRRLPGSRDAGTLL